LKPEQCGSPLDEEKYQEEKPVTSDDGGGGDDDNTKSSAVLLMLRTGTSGSPLLLYGAFSACGYSKRAPTSYWDRQTPYMGRPSSLGIEKG